MSEFENGFARVRQAATPLGLSKTGYRSLLELAARGSDGELVGFMRSLVRAAIDAGLAPEDVQLIEQAGPELAVHLLPVSSGVEAPPPEPVGEELVLFLQPGAEVGDEQLAALAKELGLAVPDARAIAGCPVPQVLLRGRSAEIKQQAAALSGAGLSLGCLALEDLLAELEPWVVEWIDVEDDGLYLNGARGRVPLRLTARALLVQGTYAYFPDALTLGASTAAARRGASAALPRLRKSPFLHLYLEGSPVPFCFSEGELRDYTFLREDMQPSAGANFRALGQILASAPQVQVDGCLKDAEPAVIQRAARLLWQGTAPPRSSSPDLDAEVLSRLLYFSTF